MKVIALLLLLVSVAGCDKPFVSEDEWNMTQMHDRLDRAREERAKQQQPCKLDN